MVREHYDPEVRRRLQANSDHDVVLNKYFEEWYEHIEWNLRARLAKGGVSYDYEEDCDLFEECRKHAEENARQIEAQSVIMLTHPFYLQLSHMQHIKTPQIRKESNEYRDRLMDLFETNLPHNSVGLVILDTIHHYAAATSLLLERGKIDAVIFTLHDDGYPVKPFELEQFSEKDIYVGGCYNGRDRYDRKGCLTRSIGMIRKKVQSEEQIWAISDLILNTPRGKRTTLKPVKIYLGDEYFPDERIITLNQLIEKFRV